MRPTTGTHPHHRDGVRFGSNINDTLFSILSKHRHKEEGVVSPATSVSVVVPLVSFSISTILLASMGWTSATSSFGTIPALRSGLGAISGGGRFPSAAFSGSWWIQAAFESLTCTESGSQRCGRVPEMHKVAEATTVAFTVFILATAGFPEISDG